MAGHLGELPVSTPTDPMWPWLATHVPSTLARPAAVPRTTSEAEHWSRLAGACVRLGRDMACENPPTASGRPESCGQRRSTCPYDQRNAPARMSDLPARP